MQCGGALMSHTCFGTVSMLYPSLSDSVVENWGFGLLVASFYAYK